MQVSCNSTWIQVLDLTDLEIEDSAQHYRIRSSAADDVRSFSATFCAAALRHWINLEHLFAAVASPLDLWSTRSHPWGKTVPASHRCFLETLHHFFQLYSFVSCVNAVEKKQLQLHACTSCFSDTACLGRPICPTTVVLALGGDQQQRTKSLKKTFMLPSSPDCFIRGGRTTVLCSRISITR